jgi:hypothetical protein
MIDYVRERVWSKYVHFCWLLHFVVNGKKMP